ncbi:MAG: GIY-YIG nuclease family protein [Fluviicola sp.]
MTHYSYILYSDKLNSFYKGSTRDILDRLHRHNSGQENYTSKGVPWKLLWYCEKPTKAEAMQLERKLKNLGRKPTIQFMLKYKKPGPEP